MNINVLRDYMELCKRDGKEPTFKDLNIYFKKINFKKISIDKSII